ncbi:MAG: SPOR domain-containing protein [Fibrobacter sp.]|nr:SPOR domain-containing protein [Fibrobacter sp.]
MKFKRACTVAVILSAFFSINSFAQTTTAQPTASTAAAQPAATAPADTQATVTIADAQKAYVAGKWKDAARLFEQACPNEPDSTRTECYLWNVLALSQIGAAKEFGIAGKRLDSLIKKTNPQKAVYADLMMTKAQFQLYMGRNEKAAEALIHAIETSQPHQAVVLKKICIAVQPKVKNATLDETCKRLDEPAVDAPASPAASQPANEQPAVEQKIAEKPSAQDTTPARAAEPAKTASADTVAKATPAPAVQPENPAPAAAPAPEKEYWILQLGAFGVKSNAELLVNNLKKQGIKGTIEERPGETKTLYLVQTGKFETKEKAVDFGASKLTPLNVEFRPILKK